MKKVFIQILTLVIFLTIAVINISAASFSDVLVTYLVDGEFGTVISSEQASFAINASTTGDSGAVVFTVPKVVKTSGDEGVIYRTPIVNSTFGNNIIKFQNGSEVIYSGTIAEAGATYLNTLESGMNYVVTFSVSDWNFSNLYYKIWADHNYSQGFIYIEVTVETQKSTDELIFEYITGNYNSIEISRGNEEIGGALTAVESLGNELVNQGNEMLGGINNLMNRAEQNVTAVKTPVGKMANILGSSLNPIFDSDILIFLITISIVSIVIIAIIRKAGD